MKLIAIAILKTVGALLLVCLSYPSFAECRKVGPDDRILVNSEALKGLGKIGITRETVFEALKDVSIPETNGCWSGVTGNFDGQIVSAGALQWNYGQNSLQPILRRYPTQFSSVSEFQAHLDKLMPTFGKLIFSEGCLRDKITTDCKDAILAEESGGKLSSKLKEEFDNLFQSDEMIQIQMDRFVALLQSVQDDLQRLFPDEPVSVRRIKWAIDTKVQQGGFPDDLDVKRVRENWLALNMNQRRDCLNALVDWYQGLAGSADQGGIRFDWKQNVAAWRKKIFDDTVSDEQADLLNLSFLRSRTAHNQSGYWQANTFQRRSRIILSAGCVGGDCVGL